MRESGRGQSVVLLLHEIYGLNEHMDFLKRLLERHRWEAVVPDLLEGRGPFPYEREEEAYRHFTERIGFPAAADRAVSVLTDLRRRYDRVCVLGYSAGATVAWICGATGLCDGVVGFYGSQIRNHTSLYPRCPTLLFFPERERSFDVDALIGLLHRRDRLRIEKMAGRHGFADPFSDRYDRRSSLRATRCLLSFLHDLPS